MSAASLPGWLWWGAGLVYLAVLAGLLRWNHLRCLRNRLYWRDAEKLVKPLGRMPTRRLKSR